ncbi:MAG: NAD kinase [Paludibacteraceae bacterium]|nr:NAD kinase [Paludibacteraceae bacterium]
MTVAVFGNTYKLATIEEVNRVLKVLEGKDVRVLLSQELRHELNLMAQYEPFTAETAECVDVALSMGGDGTVLTTASEIADKQIPILGINCGHLGFLAEGAKDNLDEILQQLIDGNYTIEERALLQVTTVGGGHVIHPYALNEVAVMKQELSSMIAVETRVDGELLHTYRADGLVVSTPTGSTAYNLSVGGPLVSPSLDAVILSPIATHSLNVRPFLLPDKVAIDLHIHSRSGSYLISIDGRSQTLNDDISLHIDCAPFRIKLVQLGERTFIQTLREKLMWGGKLD